MPALPLQIVIPGKAYGKGRPHFVRKTGIAITPNQTRKYEDIIRTRAEDAMGGAPPFDQPLAIRVTVYLAIAMSWPKKKQAAAANRELLPTGRPDTDNFVKIALDGLNEIVFRDDSLVVQIAASKVYDHRPRLVIDVMPTTIRPLAP